MKKVIDFIIEKKWDLDQFQQLPSLLREKFKIKNRDGSEGAQELVDTVIFWEKHYEIHQSLESFLNERFIVE